MSDSNHKNSRAMKAREVDQRTMEMIQSRKTVPINLTKPYLKCASGLLAKSSSGLIDGLSWKSVPLSDSEVSEYPSGRDRGEEANLSKG